MPAGQKVNSLEELNAVCMLRRSIVCPGFQGFKRPNPAAWVLSMQARIVLKMIRSGMYIYEKESK